MGQKEQNPDSLQPISHAVHAYVQGIGELASADSPALTPEMRARSSEAAKRTLLSKYNDINNEISGIESEATNLLGDYKLTGDDGTGRNIEGMKDGHLNALVEKSNLKEMIDLIDPTPKTK